MVADACVGVVNPSTDDLVRQMLKPGATFTPPPPDQLAAAGKRAAEQRARDWANLCRYRAANAALKRPPRVVFMGDSITENWAVADPELFDGKFVGRGISGQTSPQMLLRFRSDVIDLHPRVVHIMAGTNDLAGNTGATTEADFKATIESMVELAKAHHVQVALSSIPPAATFPWAARYRPTAQIRRLNGWMRTYAARNGLIYINYFDALATPDGAFRAELSNDGVHPNFAGYAIMRKLALKALDGASR